MDVRSNIPQVGDGMTLHLWSDAQAHTVRAVSKSGKTIWLSRDIVKRINQDSDTFTPGGFVGHTENPDGQKYEYKTDEDSTQWVKATWRDKLGRYMLAGNPSRERAFALSPGRHEWYDYNF